MRNGSEAILSTYPELKNGRDSLEQQELREIARQVGIVLLAVDADDPIDARGRVLNNSSRIRRMLADHDCLLVLAREVRNYTSK